MGSAVIRRSNNASLLQTVQPTGSSLLSNSCPLRLQFASDLHTEFLGEGDLSASLQLAAILPEPAAPYLALLGDIGNPFSESYRSVLAMCSSSWTKVFVIAGNHEYYQIKSQRPMSSVDTRIDEVCSSFSNVYYLRETELELDRVRILGTTLWSALPLDSHEILTKRNNDFHKILVPSEDADLLRPITTSELHELHLKSVDWLQKKITARASPSRCAIVLSHHAPSRFMLNRICTASPSLAHAFFSDLDNLMPNVRAWLSGHVHHCTVERIGSGQTLCACNAAGYPDTRIIPPGSDDVNYSKRAVLVIPEQGQPYVERPRIAPLYPTVSDDYMAEFMFDHSGS